MTVARGHRLRWTLVWLLVVAWFVAQAANLGGNAVHLRPQELPKNVHLRSNEAGLLGGIMLWR